MANRRREEYALTLEEKAKQIRLQREDVRCTDDEYIFLCTTLGDSDAGTLNLSSCQLTSCIDTSTTDTLQKAVHYRDLAEELKRDNRKLRVEMSEKIEAVRKFWRNSILEERTRAGKMVMIAKTCRSSTNMNTLMASKPSLSPHNYLCLSLFI